MVGPTKANVKLDFISGYAFMLSYERCLMSVVFKNEGGDTISVFDLQKQP
jgi:hypothetical protein